MSIEKHKETAIKALEYCRGDGLYLMRCHMRDYTPEQMQQEYGSSGKTRVEVLAEYEKYDKYHADAIAWLEGLS